MKKRVIDPRTIVFTLVILLFIVVIIHFAAHRFDLQDIKDYINSFGKWAPLVLLFIIIVTSSVGFVFTISVAVAALILGVYGAFFISIFGLTIGAAISFIIVRYIGRDFIEDKYIHHLKKLDEYDKKLGKKGFLAIFLLRLIALVPYELINIVGGLSRIRFWPYICATFLGIMPGTLLTIYFVASTKNLWSFQFFLAMFLYTAFSLTPFLSRRVRAFVFNLK